MDIKRVSVARILEVYKSKFPSGLFIARSESGDFIAVDTYSCGRAICEFNNDEFDNAMEWLGNKAIDFDSGHPVSSRLLKAVDLYENGLNALPCAPDEYKALNWAAFDDAVELPYNLTDLTLRFNLIDGFKLKHNRLDYEAKTLRRLSYQNFSGTTVTSLIPAFIDDCVPKKSTGAITTSRKLHDATFELVYPPIIAKGRVLGMTLSSYLYPDYPGENGLSVDLVSKSYAIPRSIGDWVNVLYAAIGKEVEPMEDLNHICAKYVYVLIVDDGNGNASCVEYNRLSDMANADIGDYTPYFYQISALETPVGGGMDVKVTVALYCAKESADRLEIETGAEAELVSV